MANKRYDQDDDPVVALRHGYISAPIPDLEGWTLTAGLIPLSDKFGDVLFSSDWDWNPLAFMLTGEVSNIKVRLAHANLWEGGESQSPTDDIDQWIVDADTDMGLGASYYRVNVNTDPDPLGDGEKINQNYLGVRYDGTFNQFDVGGWVLYNWGTWKGLSFPDEENKGYALKGEVKSEFGKAKVGVMALYSTGDDFAGGSTDHDAFISPATLAGTTGLLGLHGQAQRPGPDRYRYRRSGHEHRRGRLLLRCRRPYRHHHASGESRPPPDRG